MALVTKTFAAATCSWIDPATGLPEVDNAPINAAVVLRPLLIGNQGYRFCNFMEVRIQADFSRRRIVGRAFTPASGIYRGPSFARIPSHAFMNETEVFEDPDALRFTQVIGARTVSPEVLGAGGGIVAGALIGGGIGSVLPVVGTALGAIAGGVVGAFGGEIVGHQVSGFPPIWSKIQIRMYRDGRMEAQLLQHSLFPSLTFYRQIVDAKGLLNTSFERVANPNTNSDFYNATKELQLPDWQKRGWGSLQQTSQPGATSGNPWGITKGVTGGREVVPN